VNNVSVIIGRRIFTIVSAVLVVGIVMAACSSPGTGSGLVVPVSQAQTLPTNTSAPIGNSGAQAPIPLTGNSLTPNPSQSAPINPISHPGTPAFGPTIMDADSSLMAAQHYPPSGDIFNNDLFERPFNANTQDTYFPQVDILQSTMVNGNPWVYGSITLKGTDSSNDQLDGSYGLELDLNMDGRGDILVVANNPAQGDWSTDGVQVFLDANHDVGGNLRLHPEVMKTPGDGYEQKVFDGGVGTDPDLAWSMVSATQPNVVWFAFKSDLLNNASKWMWGAWAENGGLHPESFDYNDHLSLADAGNPMPGNADYPLKALAEVDNTCRWAVGFQPTGSEPGLCTLPATPAPFLPTFTVMNTPRPTSSSQPTSTPAPSNTPGGPTATRNFIFKTSIRLTLVFQFPSATPIPTKLVFHTPTSFINRCRSIPAFKCTLVAP
jgi:hypothetical protein